MLLRWIAAQSARDTGDLAGAAALFEPIAESAHPLASWAKLALAECTEHKDPERALRRIDALLARESSGFPGYVQAERARVRLLLRLGRRADAIATLEGLATTLRDESAAAQVFLPLAELLAEDGSERARLRAFSLARRVSLRLPDTRAGRRAQELSAALLKTFPERLVRDLERPRPDEKLVEADASLASLRYDEAEAAYEEIESRAEDSDTELRCRARYGRAKALIDRRARAPGASLMADVAERCPQDTDRRAWARYQAGRAYSQLGQNEKAIAQYEALVREAPEHSLADDALYRASRVARDTGDGASVVAWLERLMQRYPHGDMVPRARFALAWEAYGQGDLTRAIQMLDGARDETTEDLQGRAAYFRARWLAEAGDRGSAIEAFVQAFERTPLSYFGQLAYTRLMALAPERGRELAGRLSRTRGAKLTFEQRPELSSAGFRRVLALLSVGEVGLAGTELRGLGFTSESADVELGLLSVALLDRSQAPELAVEQVRRYMPRLLSRFPAGREVAMYELAYPVAFASLIETTAKKEGVPAAFLRAVAREESGFKPTAVSRAHAYGLVQLLLPTARLLVKSKKERVRDASALLRPELNLTLGARFMAGLAQSQGGYYALVPPAYNAGPAAVQRWVRERGHEPLDVWIENIPYDETRGYTRRVLQTYGIYHWLATGDLLRHPLEPLAPAAQPTASR